LPIALGSAAACLRGVSQHHARRYPLLERRGVLEQGDIGFAQKADLLWHLDFTSSRWITGPLLGQIELTGDGQMGRLIVDGQSYRYSAVVLLAQTPLTFKHSSICWTPDLRYSSFYGAL
jgi:hypothetical protein